MSDRLCFTCQIFLQGVSEHAVSQPGPSRETVGQNPRRNPQEHAHPRQGQGGVAAHTQASLPVPRQTLPQRLQDKRAEQLHQLQRNPSACFPDARTAHRLPETRGLLHVRHSAVHQRHPSASSRQSPPGPRSDVGGVRPESRVRPGRLHAAAGTDGQRPAEAAAGRRLSFGQIHEEL